MNYLVLLSYDTGEALRVNIEQVCLYYPHRSGNGTMIALSNGLDIHVKESVEKIDLSRKTRA